MYCEAGSTILIFHSIISKFAPTWKQESTKYGPLVKKYGLGPWTLFYGPRIFTAQWKRRQLVCSIVGSLLHVTLPALSFASNMAGMDESKHSSAPLLWLLWVFLWVFSLRGGKNRGFMDKGSQFCTLFLETLLYNKTYGIPTFLDTSTFIKLVKSLRHCPNYIKKKQLIKFINKLINKYTLITHNIIRIIN